jgi:hypothetical protein
MASILRASDLTPDELTQLLAGLRFPQGEKTRAWLDGVDGWSLDYWPGVDGCVLWYGSGRAATEQLVRELLPHVMGGRIFAPAGELRWRRLPALGERSCRTVYVGRDLDAVHNLELRYDLAGLTSQQREHPLWGLLSRGQDGETDTWIELRMPHRFRYPVDAPDPSWPRVAVKAIVETWSDERGRPHFLRLCDLQAYPGE